MAQLGFDMNKLGEGDQDQLKYNQMAPGMPGAYPQPGMPNSYPQPGMQQYYPQPGMPGAYPNPGMPGQAMGQVPLPPGAGKYSLGHFWLKKILQYWSNFSYELDAASCTSARLPGWSRIVILTVKINY